MANEFTDIAWNKGISLADKSTVAVMVDVGTVPALASVTVRIHHASALSRVDVAVALEAIGHALMSKANIWPQS